MPNDSAGSSLISTITRLIDNNLNEGAGLDNLVTVLSLLCLICVFTRQQGAAGAIAAPQPEAASASPVNKIIGDLMKGGAGGADTLMSLLPLLNNPQLKSKLNPSTIATVLGMLNNMGGKQDDPKEKPVQKAKESSQEISKESLDEEKRPHLEDDEHISPNNRDEDDEQEGKSFGRYLNWKTNF